MKYIAITFDDGREDNYSVAMPIMKRLDMPGTVYVATGFVDGTWQDSAVLESPRRALTPPEIIALKENGWEIGLHGDKHTTEQKDFETAYAKMNQWLDGDAPKRYGFSLPNSTAPQAEIDAIRNKKDKVSYMRQGRRKDNSSFTQKALYALAYYGGQQWAYDRYNRENTYERADQGRMMYSVVVKAKDRPDMIVKFIEALPDQTRAALMLHSVIPAAEAQEKPSAWNWAEDRFAALCQSLSEHRDHIRVVTAEQLAAWD